MPKRDTAAAPAPTVDDTIKPEDVAPKPKSAPRRTTTNWLAFTRAKVAPKVFRLWDYPLHFRLDNSSHTKLIPSSAKIIEKAKERMQAGEDLGIDFRFVPLRQGWPGWAKIQDAGLEIKDFRCGVCQRILPVHPQHIIQHMKRHKNAANGRVEQGGRFFMAIGEEHIVNEEEAMWGDLPDEFIDVEVPSPVTED